MKPSQRIFPGDHSVDSLTARMDSHDVFYDSLRWAFSRKDRKSHIAAVRKLLREQMVMVRFWNKKSNSGESTVRYITDVVDALIRTLWDNLELQTGGGEKLVALVAVGGYGRRELCPHSDIDLLVLTSSRVSASEQSQAETIVRNLWDYGFDAGTSVRSVHQCETALRREPQTATSFLHERFLAGNYILYRDFLKMIRKPGMPWRSSSFIRYILNERKNRIKKYGGLIQLLEPNLKEGNGCLRDVQMMLWLARLKFRCRSPEDMVREGLLSPRDLDDLRTGYGFLLQARCCLQFCTGKKDDILGFHVQTEVSREFGFSGEGGQRGVEVFMRFLYRHTKAVNRITQAFISRWEKPVGTGKKQSDLEKHTLFTGKDGTLGLKSHLGNPFHNNLVLILSYFDIANRTGMAYCNHALFRIKQAISALDMAKAEPLRSIHEFLGLCKRPERVGRMLRVMHDVRLLEVFIPDFSRIRFHTQHNMYHIYTTDEHTITVVRQLAYLKRKKQEHLKSIQHALARVRDMDVLVLACFFHDIGKSRKGDHCTSGARMVFKFMEKAGFSNRRCRDASQLVLRHLAMNEIAQRRDLDDPATISHFVGKVREPDMIHMLYVLTYCDISSVHPDAWSGWKAILLRTLYHKALEAMRKPVKSRALDVKMNTLLKKCSDSTIGVGQVKNHLKAMPPQYFSSSHPDDILTHVELARELNQEQIRLRISRHDTHCRLMLVARDTPGLLMVVSASLASLGLSIFSARIFTRGDGVAVDEFTFSRSKSGAGTWSDVKKKIAAYVREFVPLTDEKRALVDKSLNLPVPKRPWNQSFHVPPGINFSNEVSQDFSTIDISCQDQIGLMYLVTRAFAGLGVDVHSAVLTTEADAAIDAFYVTDLNNRKIEDQNKIALIKRTLEKSLID